MPVLGMWAYSERGWVILLFRFLFYFFVVGVVLHAPQRFYIETETETDYIETEIAYIETETETETETV